MFFIISQIKVRLLYSYFFYKKLGFFLFLKMILIYSYEIISLIHFESLLGVNAPTFAPIFEKYLAASL